MSSSVVIVRVTARAAIAIRKGRQYLTTLLRLQTSVAQHNVQSVVETSKAITGLRNISKKPIPNNMLTIEDRIAKYDYYEFPKGLIEHSARRKDTSYTYRGKAFDIEKLVAQARKASFKSGLERAREMLRSDEELRKAMIKLSNVVTFSTPLYQEGVAFQARTLLDSYRELQRTNEIIYLRELVSALESELKTL